MKTALIVANTLGLIEAFLDSDVYELEDLGYEVHFACNDEITDPSHERWIMRHGIDRIHHVNFPIRSLELKSLLVAYRQMRTIIRSVKPNVVHCHTSIAAAVARQAVKSSENKPLTIYTSHGFPFYDGCSEPMGTLYRLVETHYSKSTDAIITICQEDYENALKMKCPNVYFTHGVGVSLSRFGDIKFDKGAFKKSLGLDEREKIIVSVGELCANKNHEVVIRALAQIPNQGLVYVICGREVSEKGMRQSLEELSEKLKVKTIFLGYRNDIEKICRVSTIGALPSFKEGLGLSGIEMLAAGIPVVASSRQGIKDYVIDGVTGCLCDPSSPESFANGILSAIGLSERPETSAACISIALQYRESEIRVEKRAVYRSLLA